MSDWRSFLAVRRRTVTGGPHFPAVKFAALPRIRWTALGLNLAAVFSHSNVKLETCGR